MSKSADFFRRISSLYVAFSSRLRSPTYSCTPLGRRTKISAPNSLAQGSGRPSYRGGAFGHNRKQKGLRCLGNVALFCIFVSLFFLRWKTCGFLPPYSICLLLPLTPSRRTRVYSSPRIWSECALIIIRFISPYPWGIASQKRHTVAFFLAHLRCAIENFCSKLPRPRRRPSFVFGRCL